MATAGWNAFIPDLSDDDDLIPTVVWEDSAVTTMLERPLPSVARGDRGEVPSKRVVLASRSDRAGAVSREDEVTVAAHRDALVPGNVFLAPPKKTDPPPPWQRLRLKRRAPNAQAGRTGEQVFKKTFVIERKRPRAIARRQPSLLPHVTFALAAAIVVGLCYDVRARHGLAVDASHAARTASAFVAAHWHR